MKQSCTTFLLKNKYDNMCTRLPRLLVWCVTTKERTLQSHDAALLRESGLLPQLDLLGNGPNQHPYCLYGDQGYPNRPTLIVPYKGRVLTRRQKVFNNANFRISVEWGFKDVRHLFTSLDFKYGLKLYQNQVAKMYLVGTLLTNCHICLYGNQTSKYFNLKPPSLEQYLY